MTQETTFHKWIKDDSIKVKLLKMSKGYQWELTYEGVNDEEVLARLTKVDSKLRKEFIKEENNE